MLFLADRVLGATAGLSWADEFGNEDPVQKELARFRGETRSFGHGANARWSIHAGMC